MLNMLYVKIVLGLYSISAVFTNASPMLKDSEFIKGFYNTSRKKEIRDPVMEIEHTENEIISKVGDTIKLGCSVKNLGDNVVSWIRQKDLLILTSGIITFTADGRFQIDRSRDESNSWDLIIREVQLTDAGFYECQINTEPKLKQSVRLIILSGNDTMDFSLNDNTNVSAKIVGSLERFVQIGSIITITCYMKINDNENSYHAVSSQPIRWIFNSKLLSMQSDRGGINVDTVRLSNVIVTHLTIAFVTSRDSGIYTCTPIKGQSDSIKLSIIKNEEMEAVKPENYLQSNNAEKNDIVLWKKLFLLYSVLFIRFPT